MVTIKKAFSIIFALIFALLPMEVFAADLYQMQIVQAEAEKPQIVAYVNFTDTNNAIAKNVEVTEENVHVYYGNEELEIASVEPQKKSEYGVTYYYLVDNSTSVSESSLNKVKETIKQHIDEKKEKDKVVVISFASEINVVLNGTENKTRAKSAVDELKRASGGTRLYDAIAKATDLIDTNKKSIDERSVIFVITDGVDKVAGGNTVAEVTGRLGKSDVPVYAFGYDYAAKESLDSLGELARSTRGKMTVMKQSEISANILAIVSEVQNTYRIVAYSENNIVKNDYVDIRITVDSEEKYEAEISLLSNTWQKDMQAPEMVSAALVAERLVEIIFSEKIEIYGENVVFKITCEEEEIPCDVAVYNENERRVILQTEEKLYNGEYEISVEGVTDVSMEKNGLLNKNISFTIDSVPKDFAYFINEYKLILIIVGCVLLLVILVLLIVKTKKKAEQKREEEALKHGNGVILSEIDAVNAEITVIDSHRIERRVKCVIGGAYIIGRDDDKCDLAIEDKHLSHQHAALIFENGILSIQDLDSTNGTKVNGIKITRVRKLEAGDIVEIGNTRLRVKIIP
ncbi:MAG: VWA domain-containing protein [Oscillospiraceae bacterium]|nr:VWA domain-containing protein [Oscillospiraceae bacterium]